MASEEGSGATLNSSTLSVASSANKCLVSFQECIFRASTVDSWELSMIEDQVARFSTWAAALGVFASERSSTDHRLRNAPDVRNVVNGLLESLNYRNLMCSDILHKMGENPPTGPSDVQCELRQSYIHIGSEISRLNKISNTIRRASRESHFQKAKDFRITDDDDNDVESFLFNIFEHHISDRFPNISEGIRQRLVRAMIVRRKRILYRRHRQGIAAIRPQKTAPKIAITLLQLPQIQALASDNTTQDNHKDNIISISKATPSMVQSATTLDPEKFKKASSSPSMVSASKTIALDDHEYVVFPPNPGLAAQRKYERLRSQREESKKEVDADGIKVGTESTFENLKKLDLETIGEIACPYCLYALPAEVILSDTKWKNHVKNDLDPYVCLLEDCDQPDVLFSHSEEWRDHMNQHSKYWRCPSHRDFGPFSSREDYIEHMREAHRTTLSDTQLRALANRNSRTTEKLFPICPLCGEDKIQGQMESHITGHLRSLALKSLPGYQDAIPEDAANNNDSISTSRQHSRSTIKEFMEVKETLELEEDASHLVEQGNQSNTKSFLGDAHSDLERPTSLEESWDASCFKELGFNRTPWDPEKDHIFQSILLEQSKQDALLRSKAPRLKGGGKAYWYCCVCKRNGAGLDQTLNSPYDDCECSHTRCYNCPEF